MTPTQRRAALTTLGWSQRELARRLDYDEGMVRRWLRGASEPPPAIDAWLAQCAAIAATWRPLPEPPGRG